MNTVPQSRVTTASPGSLEVRLLGPVEVVGPGGVARALPSATQRRLVALLALQRGRTVRGERLADVLGLSMGALRKAVSRVREVVGEDALRTTTIGYQLDAAVDVDEFAAAVQTTRPGAARVVQLEQALARWNGDALDEFATEEWAAGEVARLESLRSVAIEELVEHYLAAGRATEAVAALAPHVARHPVADGPRALLLRALSAAGRPTEALREFQRYRKELAETTGMEPGPALCQVERRIALGWDGIAAAPVADAARAHSALPVPVTSWVGPAAPIEAVVDALATERLVTLVGPGGVGKTRTALEAAHRCADRFADGVVLVALAAISDPAQVPDLVASTIGMGAQGGMSVTESLVDRLKGRRLLLVLDNCEHVVDAAARLTRSLVTQCESLTVLATSREALAVRGERVVAARPLSVELGVELFCERAGELGGVPFDEAERAVVAELCGRLDGLPLAVELAAARARSLSPADLLARLGERFEILGRARDGEAHQATLWATIDWSYQLLTPHEQVLFDRLSVFAGTFDLAAAEQVCADPSSVGSSVGGLLSTLVDRSMVVAERVGGAMRYRLLDTLREFARVSLAERGATAEVGRRHLAYYSEVARVADRRWFSADQLQADAVFDREWDNLREAWAGARHRDECSAADALLVATHAHAQLRMRTEHGVWCAASVGPRVDQAPLDLVGWTGWWAMIAGDHARAVELCRQGLARLNGDVDSPAEAGATVCRAVLAFALWSWGRREDAATVAAELEAELEAGAGTMEPWFEYTAQRALFSFAQGEDFARRGELIAAVAERIGSPSLIASARFYQASAVLFDEQHLDPDRAVDLHEQGVTLARSVGAELPECQNLQGLLDAKLAVQAPDAVAVCIRAVTRLHELRYWLYLYRVLDGAAWLLAHAGKLQEAAELVGHLEAHAPLWRRRPRSFTLAALDAAGGMDDIRQRGATIEREQIVTAALTHLSSLV